MFDVVIKDTQSDFEVKIGKMSTADFKDFIGFLEEYSLERPEDSMIFTYQTSTFNLKEYCYMIYVFGETI